MRLSWTLDGNQYISIGEEFNYIAVNFVEKHGSSYVTGWSINQYRSVTGQSVHMAHVDTLEGAFARAQVWENA